MAVKSYILIDLDWVREKWNWKKLFLGVLVFGDSWCFSSNSTEFNAEQENTCPFPYHIGQAAPFQHLGRCTYI